MTGPELARAARALVGTPFRLHGRDPGTGLDCVGVLEAACAACGTPVRLPNGYALRCRDLSLPAGLAAQAGLRETGAPVEAGHVLLMRPAPYQHHLAIATAPDRMVHAHAGLRRVVEGPIPGDWPLLGHWRAHSPRN
ncbi:hypothetical protein [Novosphingobium mangrovi (ex Huang et al. 2023)]|uniref:NlpC/P60 domain-containing protein n=1 Tax=Novosphingobium mangrovi (ex Huang et al. 2023) TaxID=2976432 RepID=A0ABT2I318_9SPHN|nr:hypothetical protein [Novosphingobium mangrovi (ex Huang et al. 2023)]MCT2399196.1 hypothetical protein [Novosphingobium mangrovi (ex Huang et al. 2023)]